MMLSVLQPWESAWVAGSGCGTMRRPSRSRLHRISSGFPLRSSRFMPLDTWYSWTALRPRGHILDEFFEDNHAPALSIIGQQNVLTDMLESARELEAADRPEKLLRKAVCENSVLHNELFTPLKWQVNDTKKEACTEVQLPHFVKKSDDLKVELDEATRTITLKSKVVGGPNNCSVSTWRYSQRLHGSIDLDKIQALADIHKGKLQLKAPVLALESCEPSTYKAVEVPSQTPNRGKEAEPKEEQPPQSGVDHVQEVTVTRTNKVAAEQNQPCTSGSKPDRATEIEDVGPDEESDRVSISSDEAESRH